MSRNILITLFAICAGCLRVSANATAAPEVLCTVPVQERLTKPVGSQAELPAINQQPKHIDFSIRKNTETSPKIKLGAQLECANTYHPLYGKMYSTGTETKVTIKYSALTSIACVWNISWGLKITDANSAKLLPSYHHNNVIIAVIVSDPAPPGKTPSVLMRKLDTNLPLETLSAIDVIVTFAHI